MMHPRLLAFVLVVAGFGVFYSACAAPYVVHSSLAYSGYVTKSFFINASDVPSPANLYVTPGATYHAYLVQHSAPAESYLVLSTQSVPTGSLVYVNSTIQEWIIDPSFPPIKVDPSQGYDRLTLASSLAVVGPPLSDYENYLTQTPGGKAVSGLMDLALVIPLVFILLARWLTGRFQVWSLVITIWLYACLVFASDEVGSAYGGYPSTLLEAVVVGLPVMAYVVARAETYVRVRLRAQGN